MQFSRKALADPLAWFLSRRELRQWMKRNRLEEVIDVPRLYGGRGFYAGIQAIQNRAEIAELASRVSALKPRVIVEIGTCRGGTLYIWCRSNPWAQLVVSIDLPHGPFGGGYESRRGKLYREFVYDRHQTTLVLMRCDSHSPGTLRDLEYLLAGRRIDFLYIDGDHSYAGVRRDYEMYSRLVAPEGLIAFHDVVTREGDHEVYKFWGELRASVDAQEILLHPKGKMGVGLVQAGSIPR